MRVSISSLPLGDLTAQRGVLSLIDNTHAPAAQLLNDAIVGNALADHGEGPASGGHLRLRLRLSQRNRIFGTVQAAEQFAGVPSLTTPRRAGSTGKLSRLQTKISPRAPPRIMGAGPVQNGLGRPRGNLWHGLHGDWLPDK